MQESMVRMYKWYEHMYVSSLPLETVFSPSVGRVDRPGVGMHTNSSLIEKEGLNGVLD
jgi:hypothetical protein